MPESLLSHLRQEKDRQGERLASLEPLLAGGDEGRGRAMFLDKRVACATCHRVGDTGGLIGPDLTKIGVIRSGCDILESIIFPASTMAQGYENYVLTLQGGQELTGIIAERTADSVMLRDSSGAERRLGAKQIVNMRRDRKSVMPDGLDRALTPEKFRDLLAFLQNLKLLLQFLDEEIRELDRPILMLQSDRAACGDDGKDATVLRNDWKSLQSSVRSLKPDGLESALSKQQMADVIWFLKEPPEPGK
ncbi:MAG: hypothetical protein ABIP55_11695 [Tepidisphaeraceae bacterium]